MKGLNVELADMADMADIADARLFYLSIFILVAHTKMVGRRVETSGPLSCW